MLINVGEDLHGFTRINSPLTSEMFTILDRLASYSRVRKQFRYMCLSWEACGASRTLHTSYFLTDFINNGDDNSVVHSFSFCFQLKMR